MKSTLKELNQNRADAIQPFQGCKIRPTITQRSRSSPVGLERQRWAEWWNPVGIHGSGQTRL